MNIFIVFYSKVVLDDLIFSGRSYYFCIKVIVSNVIKDNENLLEQPMFLIIDANGSRIRAHLLRSKNIRVCIIYLHYNLMEN